MSKIRNLKDNTFFLRIVKRVVWEIGRVCVLITLLRVGVGGSAMELRDMFTRGKEETHDSEAALNG